MSDKRNIGIMGGTFNPIHNGHISMARKAYEQYSLEKVIFIPAGDPPHKKGVKLADKYVRSDMVKEAISTMSYFEYSNYEIEKEELSYSVETLRHFKEEYKDANLYFIIGADSLFQFETWKKPDEILSLATLLVARRNDIDDLYFETKLKYLRKKYNADIEVIDMADIPISSTRIRVMVANCEDYSAFVPESVYKYITEHELYTSYATKIQTMDDCDELKKRLRQDLKHSRYEHTISVANISAALAMKYGANVFDAYVAGLFHDMAKSKSDDELIEICEHNCINITPSEYKSPYLLHGKVAAFIAEKEYYIINNDILNALRYHTTGRPHMSLLEKIVFTADYIEPLRDKAPNLNYIRKMSFENLDKAITIILYSTIEYLTANGKPIDSTTRDAYAYYK